MTIDTIGFIGLGNIGKPMADNLARSGFSLIVYDIAGSRERAPEGAEAADSVGAVAAKSQVIFTCLPSIDTFNSVITEIAAATTAEDLIVSNLSTVGPSTAIAAHEKLAAAGIVYVDTPVSGAVFRARDGDLTVMFSGNDEAFSRLRPLLDAIGRNIFRVGSKPGQGQRMKLVNSYLVISAFLVTSEAFAYGEKGGLDMATMLDVINTSTGQNFVSTHMFPRYVQTGTYDSAGSGAIMRKDLSVFLDSAISEGRDSDIARAILDVIEEFDDANPQTDQMRIYPYIRDVR